MSFKAECLQVALLSQVYLLFSACVSTDLNQVNIPDAGSTAADVVISLQEIDFGKVHCGSTADGKSLVINNKSNQPFEFDAALGRGNESPYHIDPVHETVGAGSSITVTVTPKEVPLNSLTAAEVFDETLLIQTNIPGDSQHLIKLHQTASGARLAYNLATLDFGTVPLSTSKSLPLIVTNTGNEPANVTFSLSGPFSVSPVGPSVVPAAGSLKVEVTFTPTSAQAKEVGQLTLSTAANDSLCAPIPAVLSASGNGTNGSVAISSSMLDFGLVNCGSQAAAQILTLENTGNRSYSWTTALGKGTASPYGISPESGTLEAGASTKITVTPKSVPQVASTANGGFDDTLTITTTDVAEDSPHEIELRQTARGVILAFQPNQAINFGAVPAGTTQNDSVEIVNNGNLSAEVTLDITPRPPFGVDHEGTSTLAAGDILSLTPSFSPTTAGSQTALLTLAVKSGTVLCQPLPSLALEGTGTMGAVSISASSLNFGQVKCGQQAPAQNIIISNTGTQRFNFTAILLGKSPVSYQLSVGTGFVDPGTPFTLTITPPSVPNTSAITSDLYGDILTISTDAFGDVAHAISLHQTAVGAIIETSTTNVFFGNVAVGSNGTAEFTVYNNGNSSATVSFSLSNSVFTISPASQPMSAGDSFVATATFLPTAAVISSDTLFLQVPSETTLCGPLPTLHLEGTGEENN